MLSVRKKVAVPPQPIAQSTLAFELQRGAGGPAYSLEPAPFQSIMLTRFQEFLRS
jgi:hypothetical protein